MQRMVLVGAACAALGFGAGLLAAPALRSPPRGNIDVARAAGAAAIANDQTQGRGERDRLAASEDRAVRLAVAAASLERAAQGPRLIDDPTQRRAPPGDVIETKEEPVTLEQLPAPLRAVITQIAQGRPVQDLTLERRTRNGQPLFETEFQLDGVDHELKMDEAGKILESEVGFAISELPTQVTGGIAAVLPGAVLLEAEREQVRDNPAFFEIKIRHQGQMYEVQVAEDGRLLRTSPR